MNYHLLRHGYPHTIIDVAERAEYLSALEEANAGRCERLPRSCSTVLSVQSGGSSATLTREHRKVRSELEVPHDGSPPFPRTPPPDGVALRRLGDRHRRRPAHPVGEGFLTIRGDDLPGQEMRVHYLEAYCRPGSTDRDWGQTVIGHTTELVSASDDGKVIKLRCTLKDGVVVDHVITAGRDEVDFRLTARNPTDKVSLAHWAQPCIRVDRFVGVPSRGAARSIWASHSSSSTANSSACRWNHGQEGPLHPRPGLVPRGVPRTDVNPRPLSDIVPSNGIIGCFSADER